MSAFAVVRVRAKPGGIRPEIRETMRMLRLNRVNHCALVPDDATFRGMVRKVKDYVTWGEVDAPTVEELLAARARIGGGRPLTDEYLAEHSDYKTVKDLAAAIAGGTARLSDVPGVTAVLRLAPPRRGYEGVKRSFTAGGALGYRGGKMGDLLKRMI